MTQKQRILLVDDEVAIVRSLERSLRHEYEVFVATSGQAALEFLAGNEISIIITDQRMPEMTGVELLKEAHRRAPLVMGIVLTGYADIHAIMAAVNVGEVYRYRTKPWDIDELRQDLGAATARYEVEKQRLADLERLNLHFQQEVAHRTVELERANQDLQANRDKLYALHARLVDALEDERRSIARELHDVSAQSLTSLMLGLGNLQRRPDCSEEMRRRLEDFKQQSDTILQELHRLSQGLRPIALDRLGLAAAVRQLLDNSQKQYSLQTQFEIINMGEDERWPPEVETGLYRVVQEALTNVARHAQAKSVNVLIQRTADQAVVLIEDDGRGFDIAAPEHHGRLGILGMRERVTILGGSLTIESQPGAGTTLIASIPLPKANGDG